MINRKDQTLRAYSRVVWSVLTLAWHKEPPTLLQKKMAM